MLPLVIALKVYLLTAACGAAGSSRIIGEGGGFSPWPLVTTDVGIGAAGWRGGRRTGEHAAHEDRACGHPHHEDNTQCTREPDRDHGLTTNLAAASIFRSGFRLSVAPDLDLDLLGSAQQLPGQVNLGRGRGGAQRWDLERRGVTSIRAIPCSSRTSMLSAAGLLPVFLAVMVKLPSPAPSTTSG